MWKFRVPCWILAAISCLALGGCGSKSRAPLGGTVTINGAPMELGMITFAPVEPAGDLTSVGGKVTNGSFYLDVTRGPFPGKYRVEIYWAQKTGRQVRNGDGGMDEERKEGLPAKFNTNTELTADITSSTRKLDFALTP